METSGQLHETAVLTQGNQFPLCSLNRSLGKAAKVVWKFYRRKTHSCTFRESNHKTLNIQPIAYSIYRIIEKDGRDLKPL